MHLDANETMQAGMRLSVAKFEIVTAVAEAATRVSEEFMR